MEINNENKKSFACLYGGQNVLVNPILGHLSPQILHHPMMISGFEYLELKNLADITDEDAKALGFYSADEFIYISRANNDKSFSVFEIDFLRSHSYLIGFHDLTPEQIINAGWAKYKTYEN